MVGTFWIRPCVGAIKILDGCCPVGKKIFAEKYHITLSKELQEVLEVFDQGYFGTLRTGSPNASPTPKGH